MPTRISVPLTENELKALKHAAVEGNTTAAHLASGILSHWLAMRDKTEGLLHERQI